ncbi:Thrombospondin type-1 domain-containing protein 7A [Melipona quadrifasciata]|uniref:Thrombospondin type-1 domain-containing protein 7A n=1 Tax=Melipona quadrifasciata TaxID=166423 RepID=A0A0N0BBQ4_9HYME|nr:Thrombospondin type-1 domain-containing protein 7A [Melipona quadrifasciata]
MIARLIECERQQARAVSVQSAKNTVISHYDTYKEDYFKNANSSIAEERKEMDTQRYRYWTTTGSQMVTDVPRDNKAAIMDSIASSYALQRQRLASAATAAPRISKLEGKVGWPYYQKYKQTAEAQKAQIFEDIQRKMANATGSGSGLGRSWNSTTADITTQRQHRLRMKHHRLTSKGKRLRTRPPRDCKVGEWGPWSACSRSCGVGETQRTRKITIKPRRGGSSCPPLKETKWCGSASPCSDGKSILDSYQCEGGKRYFVLCFGTFKITGKILPWLDPPCLDPGERETKTVARRLQDDDDDDDDDESPSWTLAERRLKRSLSHSR